VSFYNQTGETPILPTPVVGVLGVIDDVTRRTPIGFTAEMEGHQLYLLGETEEELSGSEWAHVIHGHLGGRPPAVDLAVEAQLADILINASRDGLIDAAHDVSDGGVAQVLVESALRGGVGARVWAPDGLDPFLFLFAESAGRVVVAVPRTEEVRFTDMCTARRFPHTKIGVITGESLDVQDQFEIPLTELRTTWTATLPAALS
jgi:phosphoribosylformylglycinamidine synthase